CGIALEIVDGVHRHPDLPDGRGCLASDDVLTRDGDYFGRVVNLAARSVKLAEPGAVLVSRALAETCAADYHSHRSARNTSTASRTRSSCSGSTARRSYSNLRPRALSKRAETSGQLTMFQNAPTQSAFTFLYCR